MNGDMVRATLGHLKTQTRRLVKPQPSEVADRGDISPITGNRMPGLVRLLSTDLCLSTWEDACPFGAVGDRLWVREAWRVGSRYDTTAPRNLPPKTMTVLFEAGGSIANQPSGLWEADTWPTERPSWAGKYRPPMFMPRWMSRITLEITDVRVERVNQISEEDALADGGWSYAKCPVHKNPVRSFQNLFESIYGEDSWTQWVWVITFKLLEATK